MKRRTVTRRAFVGAAASSFACLYIPRRAWGANERLHVACIGAGGKGAGEVRDAAREGCNIVALCDVDERRAADTFKQFPKAKIYRDFRVMLEKQKDIDAVTVSTPDHTHAVASVMAMKMGKHVYCQKPLTHSIYEARLMAETALQMNVATQMGNQGHASESVRRGVELVQAGIIGPVHQVHVWTNRPIWDQGLNRPQETPPVPPHLDWDLWLGPAPQRPYHPAYVPFSWRGWWDFGTGALGDMACHIMDMPYWALQLESPDSVESESEGGTEESPPLWSTIRYQFPSRSQSPSVEMIWYDGKKDGRPNLPPDEVVEGVELRSIDAILVGQKGKMYFGRGGGRRGRDPWLLKPQSLLDDFTLPPQSIPRVANEDAEWIAACKGGAPALSNFSISGPFTETVLLGNVALQCGTPIQWDAKAMQATNAPDAQRFIRREYRQGWSL